MMPREDLRVKISEYIQDKITVKNAAAFYRSVHNIPGIAEKILAYIERYFVMIADTESFLELEVVQVKSS